MVFIWFNHLLKHIHHSPNASCLVMSASHCSSRCIQARHRTLLLQPPRDELEVQVTWWMDMQYGMIYQFHTYYICVWKTYGWHLWSKWSKWRKWSKWSKWSGTINSSHTWGRLCLIGAVEKSCRENHGKPQKGKPWKTPCSSWCWSWRQSMFIIRFLLVLNAGNFREWSIITSNNHPSNPQQPIHSLRLAPVRFVQTKHKWLVVQ